MGPVSRWAVRHPWSAVAVWLVMAVLIGGSAARFGGSYNDSFELPDTESASAQKLLGQIPGVEDALTEATVKVVWSPESGSVTDPATQAAATALLTGMSNNPSVTCVVTPYGPPLGAGCPDPAAQPGADQAQGGSAGSSQSGSEATPQPTPEQAKVLAGMGPAGMSVDGSVAYATVTFGAPVGEIPLADVSAVLEATQAANGVDGLTVGAGGQALEAAAAEPPSSEGIGVTIALFILLFAFGSLIGALLPVGTALLSLAMGQALVLITANFFNVATFAPTLAAMIGLGVGIDYSLFVINRYRQALEAGREPRQAVLESVRTAGRSVLFAAATVIIALSGLFVIGFEFFNGLAVASIGTVVMMMIGATFLLPAVLSLLGRRAFAVRMPWARKPKVHNPAGSGFARYGRWLQRRYKVVGGLALAVVVVLALPIGSMRLGFTDDGGRPEGSSAQDRLRPSGRGLRPGPERPVHRDRRDREPR